MSFLKSNAHWLGLGTAGLASIAGTFLLLEAEQGLPDKLKKLHPRIPPPKEVPQLDISPVDAASKLLASPNLWKRDYASLMFVSEHYILEEGQPKRPKEGSIHTHSKSNKLIPNSWFIQHKLPLFSARITLEDTDGDGFTNEEEWAAGTDPNDPNSHPLLVTKLILSDQRVINNRVRFLQYLGTKPEKMTLTVRAEDVPGTAQVDIKVGSQIPGTEFVVKSFEARKRPDPSGTFSLDASVITVLDKKSNRTETIEVQQSGNFPDRTLYFRLVYSKGEKDFSSKIGGKIRLDDSESYELIDANSNSARLRSENGSEVEITSSPK